MTNTKLRRHIAAEAARLMYQRQESEYYRAKIKAARVVCRGSVKPADLPSNAEIRDQVQVFVRLYEGESRDARLREMRLEALRMMRILCRFRPRLIGSTLTGHVRQGSDIDIHVFAANADSVASALENEAIVFDIERKNVRKNGEHKTYTHFHIVDRFPIELTMYQPDQAHYVFKSSITGKPIERASIPQLETMLSCEYPDAETDQITLEAEHRIDRFQIYEMLLLPLDKVKQSPKHHPEGDVLYHSLQVYDLAKDAIPYDEEFLLAALLHDVGKGIDPADHVGSGLLALGGFISNRTSWLIEHHMEANRLRDGQLGARATRRLRQHDDFDTLVVLSQCDRDGRQRGVETSEIEDAIEYLRSLSESC